MRNSKKSIEERQQGILQLVRSRGSVKVEDLSEIFQASPMTIRRDLSNLEEKKLLMRAHGEALSMQNARKLIPENEWISYCRECVSRYAARFIDDEDTLFINGSVTALDVLRFTEDKKVTVYTNNCHAFNMDCAQGVSLRFTGGEVRSNVMVGEYVLRNLLSLKADKTFMGCAAIYDDGEFRYDIPTEIAINEIMVTRTKKDIYILADHSKLQKRESKNNSYGSCSYDFPVTVITDDKADREILEKLEASGVKVILVAT